MLFSKNLLRLILLACTVCSLSAVAREIQFEHDYQTNTEKTGDIVSGTWERPLWRAKGGDAPSGSVVSTWTDNSKWQFVEFCSVEGWDGMAMLVENPESENNQTFRWADGSSLTLKRTNIRLCIPFRTFDWETFDWQSFGYSINEAIIVGGSGRFLDASGTSTSEANYKTQWSTSRFESTSGHVKTTIKLD